MHQGKSIICVIPARLGSTRLPQKMLATLRGKPLIQQTYEAALRVPFFDRVVVAVDGEELYDVVSRFGGEPIFTDPKCRNGTERLIELYQNKAVEGDVWVGWQGDEPFITSAVIETLLQSCGRKEEEIWTLKKKIMDVEEMQRPSVVKVVCDRWGKALYFSRSVIPFSRDKEFPKSIYKHVGIYAFSSGALAKIAHFLPCSLEEEEKLEQLRFLYEGMSIQVHETEAEILGIDTQEELLLAQRL